MKSILQSGKLWIVLIVLLSIPALLPFFHKGFFPLQDSIFVARMYQAATDLKDFQLPMRWAPGLRYGEPLFNFYAPLPYYIGGLVSLTPLSLIDTSKLLFLASFILSGVTMYMLSKELFGKFGGLISAVLYMYAPYHSVDMFVRGALSEHISLVFFPLIFLYAQRLQGVWSKKNFVLLTLSLAGLFTTHNIMTIMFVPFFGAWVIYLWSKDRDFKYLTRIVLSLLLAFGIAASYLLPAFFEKDLVQSSQLTSGYYDFRAHFVVVSQFFSTFWGYGPSVWGPEDGLSFQIGLVHWVLLAASLLSLVIVKPFRKKYLSTVGFLLCAFLFSLFMQHNKSTPIWTAIPILAFIQFPWRFLGVSIFLSSLAIGSIGALLKGKFRIVTAVVILVGVGYYFQFFHPQFFYDGRTDEDYIADIYLKNEGFIPRDYVPIFVKATDSKHLDKPRVRDGSIKVLSFTTHSSWAQTTVESTQSAKLEIPITYFPGWTVRENGKIVNQDKPTDLGLIEVPISKGEHNLSLNFDNTPVRSLGDWMSALSLLILAALAFGIWPFSNRLKH